MKIEIKNTKEEEVIDWSKPQLVVSKNISSRVVSTTGSHDIDVFQGYAHNEKVFLKDWDKDNFKPFHGTITLSND